MLVTSTLESSLKAFFASNLNLGGSPDYSLLASNFATVIDDYVRTSQDSLGNPCLLVDKTILTSSSGLPALFSSALVNNSADYFASQFEALLVSYLLTGTYATLIVPVGGISGSGTLNKVSVAQPDLGKLALELKNLNYTDIDSKMHNLAVAISSTILKTKTSISYLIPGSPPSPMVQSLSVT